MRLPLVFLAGPYSNPDPCVNTHDAIKLADRLLAEGRCAPLLPHLTHFWHTVSPKPYDEWLALDKQHLRRCDAVLRFGGESSGADGEVEFARSLGIPVFFDYQSLDEWLRLPE